MLAAPRVIVAKGDALRAELLQYVRREGAGALGDSDERKPTAGAKTVMQLKNRFERGNTQAGIPKGNLGKFEEMTETRSSSKSKHALAMTIVAVGVLVFLLQTQSSALRHDWSPIGVAVKLLLLAGVAALVYYPIALFMEGPDAIRKAVRF